MEGEGIYDRAGCGGGSDEDLIEKQETLEMGGGTLANPYKAGARQARRVLAGRASKWGRGWLGRDRPRT